MSKDVKELLERLEQLLPPAPPPTDWNASIALRWRRTSGLNARGWLQPVRHVHRMRLSDLQGIDAQIARVEQNTRQALALSRRGVRTSVLEKILGGNVLRVLDAVPAWGELEAE